MTGKPGMLPVHEVAKSWTRLSDWTTTEGLLESQLGLSNRLTETCIVQWILGRDATSWGMRELDTIRSSLDFFACTDEGCIAPLSPTLWWSMAIRMRLQHNWKNRTWFVNRGLIITIIWFRDDLLHIGKAQVGCRFYTGVPLLSLFNGMPCPPHPNRQLPTLNFCYDCSASEVHSFLPPCSSFLTSSCGLPNSQDQSRHSPALFQQSQGPRSRYWEKRVSCLRSPRQSLPGLPPPPAQAQWRLSLCWLWDSSWLLGLLE